MRQQMDMEKYINGVLKPVVDRQLRTPQEMRAARRQLGTAAIGANWLLQGLVIDDSLRHLKPGERVLPSGLKVYPDYPSYSSFPRAITLRPPGNYQSLAIFMKHRKVRADNVDHNEWVGTKFEGWHDGAFDSYYMWLPLEAKRPVVSPDTFVGLDNVGLPNFLKLIERFEEVLLPAWMAE